MVLVFWIVACERPDTVNAEVSFVTPRPGDEVCLGDIHAEVDVSTMMGSAADAALVAVFEHTVDEGAAHVVSTVDLKEGQNDGTLTGTVGWDEIAEEADGFVYLVADVGDLRGYYEGDRMELSDYDEMADGADVWARATVSVKVCPL